MRIIYREPSVAHALQLKDFVTRGHPLALDGKHPLYAGFQALHKTLRAQEPVSDAEQSAVADLDLKAERIMELARTHVRDYELRSDLRNSDRCKALLFEVTVISYVVEQNVRSLRWRRYEEGATDIVTEGPALQVECKLATGEVTIDRILKRAFRNSHQGRSGEGPFVLVAGSQTPMSPRDSARAIDWMNRNAGNWFRSHPSVGFVVVTLPANPPPGEVEVSLGVQGTMFEFGRVIALRSEVAIERVPENFHFRGN